MISVTNFCEARPFSVGYSLSLIFVVLVHPLWITTQLPSLQVSEYLFLSSVHSIVSSLALVQTSSFKFWKSFTSCASRHRLKCIPNFKFWKALSTLCATQRRLKYSRIPMIKVIPVQSTPFQFTRKRLAVWLVTADISVPTRLYGMN